MSVGILKSQTWPRSLKRLRHDNLLSVEIDIGPPQTEVRKSDGAAHTLEKKLREDSSLPIWKLALRRGSGSSWGN